MRELLVLFFLFLCHACSKRLFSLFPDTPPFIAQVYRWEVRQNDCASALMRALRESNAHVEPAAVATAAAASESDAAAGANGAGASMVAAFGRKGKAAAAEASKRAAVTAEVGEQTAEAAQAAAAADEKESRIVHLREEKQAAVAREDYKAATRLKQEILELQLQVVTARRYI